MISENRSDQSPKAASRKRGSRSKKPSVDATETNTPKNEMSVSEPTVKSSEAAQPSQPSKPVADKNPYAHRGHHPNKNNAPKVWDIEDEEFSLGNPGQETDEELSLKLSRSLMRKIKSQAQEEGVSVNEYLTELLSEGVVLRAWEIVEKKTQLRGGAVPGMNQGGMNRMPQQQGRGGGGGQHGNHRKGGHRGMSHGRYQAIMDDKASFLEYVRNQERNRR